MIRRICRQQELSRYLENVTRQKTISVKDYLVPTQKGEYLDMAFANVQSFLYIRSEPTTESEWVGKLYPDYAAKIIGPVGEWTKVHSGNVTGYVYSEYITVGNEAQKKQKNLCRRRIRKMLRKHLRMQNQKKKRPQGFKKRQNKS